MGMFASSADSNCATSTGAGNTLCSTSYLAFQLVYTMLDYYLDGPSASKVTQLVLHVLPRSPSTALPVLLATRKWSVVPPVVLNTALIPVRKGLTRIQLTAEVGWHYL